MRFDRVSGGVEAILGCVLDVFKKLYSLSMILSSIPTHQSHLEEITVH